MDEWIGPALSVDRRAARLPESHSFIEANSLLILLIDIGCHFGMKREAMLHKSRTNSGSAPGRINEQRLHVPVVDQHEGQRVVLFIDG